MTLQATLDKASYNPGDTMTLTVTTQPGDRDVFTPLSGTVTIDPDNGGPIQPATVPYTTQVKSATPAKVVVTDPQRTWAQQSDNGLVAVFTSKA